MTTDEPVPHIIPGQKPTPEQELAMEAYRLAHGNPWVGQRPTAVMVNQAIDWFNDRSGCNFPNCECNMNHPWPQCCEGLAGPGDA